MLLLMIPLTKSMTHSKKFCIPVGFMASFRVDMTAIMNTITCDSDHQDIRQVKIKPKKLNNRSFMMQQYSPLFPAIYVMKKLKKKIYHNDNIGCH